MTTKELKKDIEELKTLLSMITGELADITTNQRSLLNLMSEIKAIKMQNEEQEKKIAVLESRIPDLEQPFKVGVHERYMGQRDNLST